MQHPIPSRVSIPTSSSRSGPRIEALEARIVPAKMFGVDGANHLLTFDSSTPGTVSSFNITGLGGGEIIEGIDVRPATGQLYALGITDNGVTRTGRLYTINTTTGAAIAVGTFSSTLPDSDNWGMDFNPVVDRLRLVERASGLNLRVNPDTAVVLATDTSITGGATDAVAYDRSEGGTGLTTLYAINYTFDQLVTIGSINGTTSPNGGVMSDVGALGVATAGFLSFDIESGTGIARAVLPVGGVSSLYTINLSTGAATLVGAIGVGNPLRGLTSASTTLAVVGTAANDSLVVNATSATAGSYSLNGGAAVPFTGLTSFSFLGGAGDDTFTINNPAGTVFAPVNGIIFDGQAHGASGDTLVVQGGGGAAFTGSFVHSADDAGTLQTVNGGVTQTINVKGLESITDLATSSTLSLSFTDSANVLSLVAGVPPNSSVVRDGAGGTVDITFANKTAVTINAKEGGDTITLNNSAATTGLATLTINAGGGTDIVEVLGLASGVTVNIDLSLGVPDRAVIGGTLAAFNTGIGNLSGIQGTVNLIDSGGVGDLYIDDSGDTTGHTFVQSALAAMPVFGGAGYQISPTFLPGFFNYGTTIVNFQLATGSGSDTVTLDAFASNTAYSFFGNGGTDTLSVNDSGETSDHSYVIGDAIVRDSNTLVGFSTFEFLTLKTGSGDDQIDGTASPAALTLSTNGGDDTIRGSAFADTIDGGAGGFDTYIAKGAVGNVIITDDGVMSATFGNDVFLRNTGVPSIEHVIITGDSGKNILDARNFSGTSILAGEGGKDSIPVATVKILGGSATFPDTDGDFVTLKVSKGALRLDDLDLSADLGGFALRQLSLVDPQFKKAAVTLSAKRTADGGDGFINLGYLNAAGNDLAAVKIDGDLGRIEAGDNDAAKPGVAKLTVLSLGEFGLNTQDPLIASVTSTVTSLGSLTVKTNFINATLNVGGKLGAVKIGGDLNQAVITALGTMAPASNALAVAIKSVAVAGSVRESSILAGYSDLNTPANADAQIGSVTVRGNWVASNLVAGVQPTNAYFGDDDDALIAAPNAIFAKIAKVVISGQAFGTFGGTDHYGIVAEVIGSVSIGKAKLKFAAGTTENYAFGLTGDFRLREIV